MSKNSNSNAIYRYGRTCNNKCIVVKKSSSTVNVNGAFKTFTNNLQYYKTKVQHKHFDVANEPYRISCDKSRRYWFNQYDDKDGYRVLPLNDREQKQLYTIVTLACDKLFYEGKQVKTANVKQLLEPFAFNFNAISIASMVSEYRKIHDIKVGEYGIATPTYEHKSNPNLPGYYAKNYSYKSFAG